MFFFVFKQVAKLKKFSFAKLWRQSKRLLIEISKMLFLLKNLSSLKSLFVPGLENILILTLSQVFWRIVKKMAQVIMSSEMLFYSGRYGQALLDVLNIVIVYGKTFVSVRGGK